MQLLESGPIRRPNGQAAQRSLRFLRQASFPCALSERCECFLSFRSADPFKDFHGSELPQPLPGWDLDFIEDLLQAPAEFQGRAGTRQGTPEVRLDRPSQLLDLAGRPVAHGEAVAVQIAQKTAQARRLADGSRRQPQL